MAKKKVRKKAKKRNYGRAKVTGGSTVWKRGGGKKNRPRKNWSPLKKKTVAHYKRAAGGGFRKVKNAKRAPKGWIKGTAFKIVRSGGKVKVLVKKKGRG